MNDIRHEEIRRLWADGLARTALAGKSPQAPVPESTWRLLTDIGLPAECPLDVTLYRDERLLLPVSSGAGASYLTVGDDFGTTLGLTPGSGELWSFQTDDDSPPRFVNASLDAFVLFLGLYESTGNLAALSDRKRAAAVAELGRELATYDAAALDDTESWWSVILEQRAQGLL
ncbi:SUKH-4 family immunity protein [Streptomyces lanatus]|uniref:SUKH-4 family immunity protein n=1 Tax=Streptomyces lanatus TaxID=66900 RepID=A0ABV1XLT5_9ACTN|nr:SUKH-4 family immunity protein [Streptomyces lanatus]